MRYFLINEHTPFEIREALEKHGICIPLPLFSALPEPVCFHPDMLIADLCGTLFVHREYTKGQEILSSLGVPFRISETAVGKMYPKDVALNCFCIGDLLFANKKAVSETVRTWAQTNGKTLLPVSQGYAKCATVIAGGAIASADKGIVNEAQNAGIPALLLPSCHIDIETYDTGFLGGCCGLLDANTIGFFGKIENYPAYDELNAFFSTRGVEMLSLSEKSLFDFGGMVSFSLT